MGRGPKKQNTQNISAPGVRSGALHSGAPEISSGAAAQTSEELRQEALSVGSVSPGPEVSVGSPSEAGGSPPPGPPGSGPSGPVSGSTEAYRQQQEIQKGIFNRMANSVANSTGMSQPKAKDVLKNTGLITLGLAVFTPLGPFALAAGLGYLGSKCLSAWRKNREKTPARERSPFVEALRETFAGNPRNGSVSKTLGATALGSTAVGGALSVATGGAFIPIAAAVAGVSLAGRAFSAWSHAKERQESSRELHAARMDAENMRNYADSCIEVARHASNSRGEDTSMSAVSSGEGSAPTPSEGAVHTPSEASQVVHSAQQEGPEALSSSAEQAPIETSSGENIAPPPQSSRRKKKSKTNKSRCQGSTISGSRCKMSVPEGETYCKIHLKKMAKAEANA